MSETSSAKLNKGGYFLRPYGIFQDVDGRKPSYVETVLKGVVCSFARADLPCNYGYKNFTSRLHVSKSSVSRKMAHIKKDDRFDVARNGGKNSTYTYKGDFSKGFIITPDFFCTTEFEIDGKKRRLKGSEIDLLSLIYSHTFDGGKFVASYGAIAGVLNYDSTRTVLRAVKSLFKMDLIARTVRGENKHCENEFTVQLKTLRKYEKADRRAKRRAASKTMDKNTSLIDAANAKAERERFYALRRADADRISEKNQAKANENIQYREIARRLRDLEFELAKAELLDPANLPKLKLEKARLSKTSLDLLAKMNLKPEDLEPQWACKKCSDTGYLPDGIACDCYRLSRGAP